MLLAKIYNKKGVLNEPKPHEIAYDCETSEQITNNYPGSAEPAGVVPALARHQPVRKLHPFRNQSRAEEGTRPNALNPTPSLETQRAEHVAPHERALPDDPNAPGNDDLPQLAVGETALSDALQTRVQLEDDLVQLLALIKRPPSKCLDTVRDYDFL